MSLVGDTLSISLPATSGNHLSLPLHAMVSKESLSFILHIYLLQNIFTIYIFSYKTKKCKCFNSNYLLLTLEMWLAHKLGLKEGMRVLDVGCGVGGPMRTIARYILIHLTRKKMCMC